MSDAKVDCSHLNPDAQTLTNSNSPSTGQHDLPGSGIWVTPNLISC